MQLEALLKLSPVRGPRGEGRAGTHTTKTREVERGCVGSLQTGTSDSPVFCGAEAEQKVEEKGSQVIDKDHI